MKESEKKSPKSKEGEKQGPKTRTVKRTRKVKRKVRIPKKRRCQIHGTPVRIERHASDIDYSSVSEEEFQSISEQYTYWIEHSSSQEEYLQYVSEFNFFNIHISEFHTEWETFEVPVVEDMETEESRKLRKQSLIEEYKIRQKSKKAKKSEKKAGGKKAGGKKSGGKKAGGKKAGGECNCCKNCKCACNKPARLIASPLYEEILCFYKSSKHAKELISKGVHAMTLEEANFDVGCAARINKIKYSASEDEYNQSVTEYKAFTADYSKQYPDVSIPEVPKWRGEQH